MKHSSYFCGDFTVTGVFLVFFSPSSFFLGGGVGVQRTGRRERGGVVKGGGRTRGGGGGRKGRWEVWEERGEK